MNISFKNPVAYFCAEYGLNAQLPLYAGGLGVLAGDTLKAAADMNYPMVGIGLLYRGNRSLQHITTQGEQTEEKREFDPVNLGLEHVYIEEMPLFIKVHLSSVDVWVRCWKKTLSERVVLYLLDTDTDQNPESQRKITHTLYYGSEDELLKQQMILGIGGVKLLHELGIHPALYHLNEGRPVFLHWQLIRTYMAGHGMSYIQAKAEAINKTVYTNHTLVAAGNKTYPTSLVQSYAAYYAQKMGISLDELTKDGIETRPGEFSLTQFALNVSKRASAVSQVHAKFCKEAWPNYHWVGVTNGVHLPTWQSQKIKTTAGDLQQLWQAKQAEKQALQTFVAKRSGYGYDPNRLVMTWARRIADYKQLETLFKDVDKLGQIIKDQQRPVQLLVAGKAHFGDLKGKELIHQVITFMKGKLAGNALFVPDYDLDLAAMLVKGSDLWINTPIYGREACGTSGMKAIANGTLALSVADGWMAEVEIDKIGWELDHNKLSESFYDLLARQVVPEFYTRNELGLPESWLAKMQVAIRLSEAFSSKRMLEEYGSKLYS